MGGRGHVGDRFGGAFLRNRKGNVTMMWALLGSMLVGLIGVTVDFTRAQALRAQMQNAVDGAALVAERTSNLSMADRTEAARAFENAIKRSRGKFAEASQNLARIRQMLDGPSPAMIASLKTVESVPGSWVKAE